MNRRYILSFGYYPNTHGNCAPSQQAIEVYPSKSLRVDMDDITSWTEGGIARRSCACLSINPSARVSPNTALLTALELSDIGILGILAILVVTLAHEPTEHISNSCFW
jgi:hypothetical protein